MVEPKTHTYVHTIRQQPWYLQYNKLGRAKNTYIRSLNETTTLISSITISVEPKTHTYTEYTRKAIKLHLVLCDRVRIVHQVVFYNEEIYLNQCSYILNSDVAAKF